MPQPLSSRFVGSDGQTHTAETRRLESDSLPSKLLLCSNRGTRLSGVKRRGLRHAHVRGHFSLRSEQVLSIILGIFSMAAWRIENGLDGCNGAERKGIASSGEQLTPWEFVVHLLTG